MSSALTLRASLADMLAAEGVAVTIQRQTAGVYDPVTGTSSAPTTTTHEGRGRLGAYVKRMIDGTSVLTDERRLTFQPNDWSFEPLITDRVTAPENLAIVGPIQKRELGGVPFSYTLIVRKAG